MKKLGQEPICPGPLAHHTSAGGNEDAGHSAVVKSPAIQPSTWLGFASSPKLLFVMQVSSTKVVARTSMSLLRVCC